jgi:hypothetical protein
MLSRFNLLKNLRTLDDIPWNIIFRGVPFPALVLIIQLYIIIYVINIIIIIFKEWFE